LSSFVISGGPRRAILGPIFGLARAERQVGSNTTPKNILLGSIVTPPDRCYIVGQFARERRMARKPADQVQLKLRFNEALRSRLEKQADRNNHSMNAEIIRRLEQSFQEQKDAAILSMLVGSNDAAAELLRKMVAEFQANPDWDTQKTGRQKIATKIDTHLKSLLVK
jgi:hypothetical protein